MSPQLHTDPHIRSPHPQRPWRRVEHDPRSPARTTARTYCAPVVRELPPRRDYRAGTGTW